MNHNGTQTHTYRHILKGKATMITTSKTTKMNNRNINIVKLATIDRSKEMKQHKKNMFKQIVGKQSHTHQH